MALERAEMNLEAKSLKKSLKDFNKKPPLAAKLKGIEKESAEFS
jgi:hypothetical protein